MRDDGLGGRQRVDVGRAKGLVDCLHCGMCEQNMFTERRKKNVSRKDPCAFELAGKGDEHVDEDRQDEVGDERKDNRNAIRTQHKEIIKTTQRQKKESRKKSKNIN